MDTQEEIRQKVKRRCMAQTEIAREIGLTNIYFNTWLKGHREISEASIERIKKWLELDV